MDGIWIWLAAAILYGGFLAWYENWRGALRPEEIDDFARRLDAAGLGDAQDRESLRRFMAEDDGREFVMLNLVRLNPDPLPDPETGEPTPAGRLLRGYLSTFLPRLARRAGHPLLQARKIGGYVDSWGVAPDPGWSFMGLMRYRSRRDLMELILSPGFADAHAFKRAAMPTTFSFPTRAMISLQAGPRVWVGLVLASIAAILQLAVGTFGRA